MLCVIPSLYSYSVQWEAFSSSTPAIAELGYCYLPLGAPNLVRCASCVEQIRSGCLWVWDHPGANPCLACFPTVGPYPTSGTEVNQTANLTKKAEQHRYNLTTGKQI